jgi:hypothetical protein
MYMRKNGMFLLLVPMAAFLLACSVGSVVQQAAPLAKQAAQSVETQAPSAVQPTQAPSSAQPTRGASSTAPAVSSNSLGKNIIFNGNAEAGPGAPDDSTIVPAPGWTGSEKFTVVQYGASGGFQDASSPGPKDRGKNFFAGGPDSEQSTAKQTIQVASLASQIDAQQLTYKFEGWLGGYQDQDDNATVTAEFMDASGKALKKATLGPVMAADRDSTTGLIDKSTAGVVPKGTRSIVITMTFVRTDGAYNDASVDNLSLVLTKAAAG